MNIRTPLDTGLEETAVNSKSGQSEWQSFLGLVAWGDAGYHSAAKNGGLTKMNHADQQTLMILGGLYYKKTTIVYGE